MSHPLLKTAIRFFFISILLILPVKIASACLCGPVPTVLDAYDAADEVLIVRVLSVPTVQEKATASSELDNSRLTIVRIERVYKGTANVGDEFSLRPSGPSGCGRNFAQDSVNNEFLFYLKTPDKPDAPRQVSFCNRSNKIEAAREDVLYLDNLEKHRGKTRVSGIYLGSKPELLTTGNRKIQIIGSQKSYETYTDETGVFEIYDLPPGNYRVVTEIPTGWKFWGWYPLSITGVRGSLGPGPNEFGQFVLEPKKHASFNMIFLPDSTVAGTIVGPTGNPLLVCAHLWKPDQTQGEVAPTCTDKKGRFLFDSVVPGTYLLVLNPADQVSSEKPFPRLFYPGTAQREKAVLIDVAVGEKVKNINLVVPKIHETVTVEGVLYFANDRPVTGQPVRFSPTTAAKDVSGIAYAHTDDEGRFELKVLKGLSGMVSSEITAHAGMFEDCPAFDALVNDSGKNTISLKTTPIKVEAKDDINNLVLQLPIPNCKLKK